MFMAKEHLEGRDFELEFHWVHIDELDKLEMFPSDAKEMLLRLDDGVKHFVYKE